MINVAVKCNRKMPMNKVFWYPCCFLVANRYVYNVLNIFLHIRVEIYFTFVVDMYLKLSDETNVRVRLFVEQRVVAYFFQNNLCFYTIITFKYDISEWLKVVNVLMN